MALVDPRRDFFEAALAGGPDTADREALRELSNQYLPGIGEPTMREVILVNFGESIPNECYAVKWARNRNLSAADPRTVFAVCEQFPKLHRELREICHLGRQTGPISIVSPMSCTRSDTQYAVTVWWNGSFRSTRVRSFESIGDPEDWSAFLAK